MCTAIYRAQKLRRARDAVHIVHEPRREAVRRPGQVALDLARRLDRAGDRHGAGARGEEDRGVRAVARARAPHRRGAEQQEGRAPGAAPLPAAARGEGAGAGVLPAGRDPAAGRRGVRAADAAAPRVLRLVDQPRRAPLLRGAVREARRDAQEVGRDAHVLRVHGGGPVEGDVPLDDPRQPVEARPLALRPRRGAERRRAPVGQELVQPGEPPVQQGLVGAPQGRLDRGRARAVRGVRQVAPPPVHHRRLAARVLLRRKHVGAAVRTPRPPPPRPRRPARAAPPARRHLPLSRARVPRAAATRRARRRRRSGSATCLRRATR